jgi:hypothetical protein
MARGGRRQGTPGVSYGNRTDLAVDRAPQQGTATAASGGVQPPPQPMGLAPDEIPSPIDPSSRPHEPVTAGLPSDFPKVTERNDARDLIQALMLQSPNPDLARLLARMDSR